MAKTRRERFIGTMVDGHFQQNRESGLGYNREQLINGKTGEKYGRAFDILESDDETPEPPDPTDKRPYFEIDGMGFFMWFLFHYWDRDTRQYVIDAADETIAEYAKYRPRNIHGFMWVRDTTESNAHFRPMCPHPSNDDGFFDLSEIKNKYLRAVEAWAELMKKHGVDFAACAYMARYCFYPFEHNVNNVSSFYDPRALQFQINFVNAILDVIATVFGETYRPYFRMINEPAHGGSHHRLHVITNWHANLYTESKLIDRVPYWNLYCDESGSAGAIGWAHERLPCPKYNPNVPEPLCDGTIGGNVNGGSINPNTRKPIVIVNHGYSIIENWNDRDGARAYAGSAWPQDSAWCAGGDGGAGAFKELARGYKIHMNDDPNQPVIWAQGDANQTHELNYTAVDFGFKKQRDIRVQLSHFETLRGWPLMENYEKSFVDWERVAAAADGHDAAIAVNTPS